MVVLWLFLACGGQKAPPQVAVETAPEWREGVVSENPPAVAAPYCGLSEGQSFAYRYEYRRQSPESPELSTFVFSTDFKLVVEATGPRGYSVTVDFDALEVSGDPSTLPRQDYTSLALYETLGEAHRLELELDAGQQVVEVKDLPAHRARLTEAYKARLISPQTPPDLALYYSNMADTFFGTDPALTASLIRLVVPLLVNTCLEFSLNEAQTYEETLPNPFGGAPLRAVGETRSQLLGDALLRVEGENRLPEEDLKALVDTLMRSMLAGVDPSPLEEMSADKMHFGQTYEVEIDMEHGFPTSLGREQRWELGILSRVETNTHTLLSYTPAP